MVFVLLNLLTSYGASRFMSTCFALLLMSYFEGYWPVYLAEVVLFGDLREPFDWAEDLEADIEGSSHFGREYPRFLNYYIENIKVEVGIYIGNGFTFGKRDVNA